jgi:hypothetical protein
MPSPASFPRQAASPGPHGQPQPDQRGATAIVREGLSNLLSNDVTSRERMPVDVSGQFAGVRPPTQQLASRGIFAVSAGYPLLDRGVRVSATSIIAARGTSARSGVCASGEATHAAEAPEKYCECTGPHRRAANSYRGNLPSNAYSDESATSDFPAKNVARFAARGCLRRYSALTGLNSSCMLVCWRSDRSCSGLITTPSESTGAGRWLRRLRSNLPTAQPTARTRKPFAPARLAQ